jgi:general secretion pathway protein G
MRCPAPGGKRAIGFGLMIVLAGCASAPDRADSPYGRAQSDLRTVSGALKQYRRDMGQWPENGQGLKALVERPPGASTKWHPFLAALPTDPWGRHYQYRYSPALDRVSVWSFGEDVVDSRDDIRVDRLAGLSR